MLKVEVDRTTPVRENVLGTAVQGNSRTTGHVTPVLVPSRQQGILQLHFSGVTSAPRMRGRNGPATIFTSSQSRVEVRKNIVISDQGLRVLPARAEVSTRLNVTGVQADRRIVERIARRRAWRAQPAARSITSARTGARVQAEIDQSAAKPFRQVQELFVSKLRQPLVERQSLPKLFQFSTTQDHLRLVLRQCSHSHFPPPADVAAIAAEHDIAVALHESAIGSVYEVFFAGRPITDCEFLHGAHLLTGEDPRPLRVHARAPRWSVTAMDERPVVVTFDDDQTTICMRLQAVNYDQFRFVGEWDILARYRLEKTDRGPRMSRVGDLTINGDATSRSGGESIDINAVLRTKFNAVFPEVLAFHGLVPPTGGVWTKVGMLQLEQLDAEDGWLMVGYQLPRVEERVTTRTVLNR